MNGSRKLNYIRVLLKILAYGSLVIFMFSLVVNIRLVVTSGCSMTPTYAPGDVLLCVRSYSAPAQDEVVLINHNDKLIIKRVVYVAGEQVPDTGWYSKNGNEYEFTQGISLYWGSNIVPEGYVYVLGDNSADSHDSRYEDFGLIPIEEIWGKVISFH